MHVGKLDERLHPLLDANAGVLQGDWYRLPLGVARGYMLSLSRTLAGRRGLSLATDSPEAWIASAYLEADGNIGEHVLDADGTDLYCQITIEDFLPVGVERLSMRTITRFAANHRDERTAFRLEISSLINKLAQCESADYARDLIEDARQGLGQRVEDYRNSILALDANMLTSALTVGVTATMAVLATMPDPFQPVHFGAGLAYGAVATMADAARAKQTRQRDLVASYLAGLPEARGIPNLPYYMNEFVND